MCRVPDARVRTSLFGSVERLSGAEDRYIAVARTLVFAGGDTEPSWELRLSCRPDSSASFDNALQL
eukprot:3749960-Prymnesium_polylepis.3